MIFTYTPKEREQIAAVEAENAAALDAMEATIAIKEKYGIDSPQFKEAKAADTKRLAAVDQHFTELLKELESSRFKKLKTPAAILEDAKQQTLDAIIYAYVRVDDSITPSDRAAGEKLIANLSTGGLYSTISRWDYSKAFKKQKKAAFKPENSLFLLDEVGLIAYIKRAVLEKHIAALKGLPEAEELENYVLQVVAASPYTINPATVEVKAEIITTDSALLKPYMVMYHGKATDQLAQISSKGAEFNPLSGNAKAKSGGVTVTFREYQSLKGTYGINEHKLLSTAIATFTSLNNYSKSGKGATNYRVAFPLKEYALACGYDVEERDTETPEAAAKEKKRAANALKDARKKFRNSLEVLDSITLEWNEGIKGGAAKDFSVAHLISGYSIRGGQIAITFNPDFGDYIAQNPQTQYPTALLAIDARNNNAYSMGLKMAEHFNMDNNQIRGTAERLKVETLLASTGLPDISAVQKRRGSWEERIKEPFETALDTLTRAGVLEDWKYTRAKGVELTDAEAAAITDYETFISLYITYKLADAPDHTERLARRAEEKQRNQQRKKAHKKKA